MGCTDHFSPTQPAWKNIFTLHHIHHPLICDSLPPLPWGCSGSPWWYHIFSLFSVTHIRIFFSAHSPPQSGQLPSQKPPQWKITWTNDGMFLVITYFKCWSIASYGVCQNKILEDCRWMPVNCIFCELLEVNPFTSW